MGDIDGRISSQIEELKSALTGYHAWMRRLPRVRERTSGLYPYRIYGRVNQVVGHVIEGKGPLSSVGDSALIYPLDDARPYTAEVVGFRDGRTMLMPLGDLRGIGIGSRILSKKQTVSTPPAKRILGRVIDGLGHPMDGKGPLRLRGIDPHLPGDDQPHEEAAHHGSPSTSASGA